MTNGVSLNIGQSESRSDSRTEAHSRGSSLTVSADPKVKTTRTTQEGTQTSDTKQLTHGTQVGIGFNTQLSVASTSSTNSSERHGTSRGTSTTWELRKDFNVYPGQFGQFQDPSTTGFIAGIYKVPSLTGWRVDLPFDALEPEYEREEALHSTPALMPWPDKWEVSRPRLWSTDDYERLGMEPPSMLYVNTQKDNKGLLSTDSAARTSKRLTNDAIVEESEDHAISYLDLFLFEE